MLQKHRRERRIGLGPSAGARSSPHFVAPRRACKPAVAEALPIDGLLRGVADGQLSRGAAGVGLKAARKVQLGPANLHGSDIQLPELDPQIQSENLQTQLKPQVQDLHWPSPVVPARIGGTTLHRGKKKRAVHGFDLGAEVSWALQSVSSSLAQLWFSYRGVKNG